MNKLWHVVILQKFNGNTFTYDGPDPVSWIGELMSVIGEIEEESKVLTIQRWSLWSK